MPVQTFLKRKNPVHSHVMLASQFIQFKILPLNFLQTKIPKTTLTSTANRRAVKNPEIKPIPMEREPT